MAKRVLVVDDDENTVRFLSVALEENGYEPITAYDGDQGYKRVEESIPDLILLDVMMPAGTEGFQFVWKLRNEYPEDLAQTPIIVLTAIHDTTRLKFYPERGDGTYEPGEYLPVQGFIDKPAEPAKLLKQVAEVLGDSGR